MRRILAALVKKKRAGKRTRQAVWDLRDLMFISATGEGNRRGISFAHFRETEDGQPQLRTFLWDAHETQFYHLEKVNLEALRWPADPADLEGWRAEWAAAFTAAHREVITTAQALASQMAHLAAATRALVNEVFQYEKANGPLHKLYDAFKRALIHDLSTDDFADMYAQTVAYGLFSARATPGVGPLDLENAAALIPKTNPFLRELFAECLKVGREGKHQIDLDELGVGELVDLLNRANMPAIEQDFGRTTRGADPVIHFYESFLREYDAEKKVRRGVFYTPDPVVSFIVRSVDHLLRTEFGCKDGLATPLPSPDGRGVGGEGEFSVQVLDPATGTGTFLKYVIEQIYDTFTEKHKRLSHAERKKKWNEYVPTQLLPRLYGFELMMAPYAVAHMKLGLALKQTEYDFASDERLRVYLTNALQSVDEIPRVDTPFLAHEAEEANTVKTETPITVIIGNPPYSGHSANKGEWIGNLLKGKDIQRDEKTSNYFEVDGKPLKETQLKWIHDDYVKFIRFAHWRVEQTGMGIVALITNNGYLDNPTFRGMRQQLLASFAEIYALNLHGSTKKRETHEDGTKDENVFDIQQGVAICLMVKRRGQKNVCRVFHADLYGARSFKYEQLIISDVSHIAWNELIVRPPFYLFEPQDNDIAQEYGLCWGLREIMLDNTVGIITARDSLTIRWTPEEVLRTVRDFASLRPEIARQKYDLGKDARDWKVEYAQDDVKSSPISSRHVTPLLYRPFDIRFTYYTGQSRGFIGQPQQRIMRHMVSGKNLGFITSRAVEIQRDFEHILCTSSVIECHAASLKETNYLFPLYIYPIDSGPQHGLFAEEPGIGPGGRKPNLSPKFISELEARISLKFIPDGTGDLKKTVGPEDIFHYMYAVFHSPTYRARYAEFLKIDFPHLPLTHNLDLFRALAAKGKELVSLHLLDDTYVGAKHASPLRHPITKFTGKGDNVVAKGYPKYEDETVWVNNEQGFAGVPENVWEFHIGGYQVCQALPDWM